MRKVSVAALVFSTAALSHAGGNDSAWFSTTKYFHYTISYLPDEPGDVTIGAFPTRRVTGHEPAFPTAVCQLEFKGNEPSLMICSSDNVRAEFRGVTYRFVQPSRSDRLGRLLCHTGCKPPTPRVFRYIENIGEDG